MTIDGGDSLESISCPTTSFCAAVDGDDVLTSTDPTLGSSWEPTAIDLTESLKSISCPTAGFCAAIDGADDHPGKVFTSTDPTGGSGAWTPTTIDTPIQDPSD